MRVLGNIISLLFLISSITCLPLEENDVVGKVSETSFHKTEVTDTLLTDQHRHSRGAAITVEPRYWPNATIPYHIKGFSTEERDMIKLAMDTWQYWTCVQFVPYDPITETKNDYIVIENGTDCASFLGRIGGRQELVLESPKCFDKVGTILHELNHVMGVIEEVSRNDRDQYVTINEDNIIPTKQLGFFKFETWAANDRGVPYDYNSIMHFGEYASSVNNEKTVVPKNPRVEIGQREGITVRDAMLISKMYNCNFPEFMDTKTDHSSRLLPNIYIDNSEDIVL